MFGIIPFPVKLLAGVFLIIGAAGYGYMKGSAHAEIELSNYRAKAEKQISTLKDENTKISNKVVTEYVDRTNTIREKEIVYVDTAKKHLPPSGMLSNGWVYTHDTSATGGDADSTRVVDASASGIEANQALITVIGNYSRCMQNNEQLIGLQKWINDNRVAIDKVNQQEKK